MDCLASDQMKSNSMTDVLYVLPHNSISRLGVAGFADRLFLNQLMHHSKDSELVLGRDDCKVRIKTCSKHEHLAYLQLVGEDLLVVL